MQLRRSNHHISKEDRRYNVIKEIADVYIIIEQLKEMFNKNGEIDRAIKIALEQLEKRLSIN